MTLVPGTPLGPDSYIVDFTPYSGFWVSLNVATGITSNLVPDNPNPIIHDFGLDFRLPEAVAPGDVTITVQGHVLYGLRFASVDGAPTMALFRDAFPSDFNFSFVGNAIANLNSNIVYQAGTNPTILYEGVGNIPEPATWALMFLGFGFVILAKKARRYSCCGRSWQSGDSNAPAPLPRGDGPDVSADAASFGPYRR